MGEALAQLQAPPFPNGVDATKRESYLSDDEFQIAMGCSKAEFENLPKWKRDNKKRQAKLF